MRRYVFYKVSDAHADPLKRPFHLRTADELERTRRALFGEEGTFGTDDLHIVDNPYFRNDPKYPYSSPHYVTVCADETVDFAPFDREFRANCLAAGLSSHCCGEGLWSFEREMWASFTVVKI